VAVIAATQRAEDAVGITVAANAEKEAAEARAIAMRTEAIAEADAKRSAPKAVPPLSRSMRRVRLHSTRRPIS
jgi:hypothetical protein